MPDASDMMQNLYETYADSSKTKHKTRVATSSMQWVIKSSGGKTIYVKFDKNFGKKHLFTYTKKDIDAEVNAEARVKAGVGIGPIPAKFLKDARDEVYQKKNNDKFTKQAKHRTVAEQKILCKTCGHEEAKHKTSSGKNSAPCKAPKASGGNCGCDPFVASDPVGVYEKNRKAKGKPTNNPLEGATTDKTTYIVLNEIPKAKFEQVVCDSILGQASWAPAGEEITWDFNIPGCIVTVDTSQTPSQWLKAKGVQVMVKEGTAADTYVVFHLHGTV